MNIELIIQEINSGDIYNVSSLCSSIDYETSLFSQPGKLTFNLIQDDKFSISEGSVVSFKVDGKGLFFGYIFKYSVNEDKIIKVIAYDQMRYLKNKDTYIFQNMTSSDIFTKICKDFQLDYSVVDSSSFITSPRINDNKTLFEIIQGSINETLIHTGNWFIMKDNFGKLEFISLNSLKLDLFIGDESLLTNYSFESSIDDDTYTQVKLIREDKEEEKREVYIVKDSENITKWGILQYFERLDESANIEQIKERAEMILKLKNRNTKKLKLNCLGDIDVNAGNAIVLAIKDLKDFTGNQYFLITTCKHSFNNNYHKMQLDIEMGV